MSKSTFRILFYLRKNYLNKSGKAGIMIRLTVNGDMVQFSSKLDIEPSLWDTKAGKAAGNSVKARQMNSMLEDIRTALSNHYRYVESRDSFVTAEKVRNAFLGYDVRQQTLLELFKQHNEDASKLNGISKAPATLVKYDRTYRRLEEFMKVKYKVSDIAKNNGWITIDPFANYHIHMKAVDRGYLTEQELERILQKDFNSRRLEQVRDVFIFSCNTDLLDKAKLEKRIASLEGERKSFHKGKRDSELKLESKTSALRNNQAVITGMTEDWEKFTAAVQTDKEGNRLNPIRIDGLDTTDEKIIGKRLQEIAKNATTGGQPKRIGELYGFPVKVVSERTLSEGLEFTDNRFFVEGNYKYTYNNGHLAMADTHAAAVNFLNALEKIPSVIEQYKAKNETLEREIPQLQEIAGKTWKKEDELKQLKSELAALDRKIQLELAPKQEETPDKGQEQHGQAMPKVENVPKPDITASDYIRNPMITGRPGISERREGHSMKM